MRVHTLVAALKQCIVSRDVEAGKRIHSHLICTGFRSIFVESTLIHMYSKCGSMIRARCVFDSMPVQDEPAWNALILGYVENAESKLALQLFYSLLHEQKCGGSCVLNARTYMAALTACSTLAETFRDDVKLRNRLLREGQRIHLAASENGCRDIFIESMLITLFSRLGNMPLARKVSDSMAQRNVVAWTALLQGYAENGQNIHTLELFDAMLSSRCCPPNARTYSVVLSSCAALVAQDPHKWMERAKRVHEQAVESRCGGVYVHNALITMYAAGGKVDRAHQIFQRMPQHNVVAWNSLMQGCIANGQHQLALEFFHRFEVTDTRLLDPTTYVAALTACSALAASNGEDQRLWLDRGREIYTRALTNRCCNVYVETTMIKMFSQSGCMSDARDIFDSMSHRTVVSWTALIQGYVENGEGGKALEVFQAMEADKTCSSNSVTFAAALQACVNLAADAEDPRSLMNQGRAVYTRAVKHSCGDLLVETSLMSLYAACGDMLEARSVFNRMNNRDIVCWNTLIQGYVENGESEEALTVFDQVLDSETEPRPNPRTYLSALMACASLGAATRDKEEKRRWLERGREIHCQAETDNCCDVFVENALVDMYSKCGCMTDARRAFERIDNREEFVCWSSLIRGYVENGENQEALELVACMYKGGGGRMSSGTSVPALMACGSLMSTARGKDFHGEIIRYGLLEQETSVATGLIDFYGRCGSMEMAKRMFDSVHVEDNLPWNSLLGGYSQRGDSQQVLEHFHAMKDQGLSPDKVSFTHVLAACSHGGLTNEGLEHFNEMRERYGIEPDVIHHNCVVDLLARANLIDRAVELVRGITPNVVTWNTLLSGCKKWKNVEVGEMAYRSLIALGAGKEAAGYNLMANIYTDLHNQQQEPGDKLYKYSP